jgi:DNA-binding CsgD family transcriptional regulator
VLLLLSDPERGAVPDAALQRRLRAIYGLTAAEATVAARVAGGAGLPEVARSLGLAVATARTHAQRVFSKAGVRGQAELARQVERLSLLRAATDERAEH